MSSSKTNPETPGIPQQIIAKLLDQLTADQVSPDVIERLKKTLLYKGDISEAAIKAALTTSTETV